MALAAIGSTGTGTRRSAPARLAIAIALALWLTAPAAQAVSPSDVGRGFKAMAEDAFDLIILRPTGAASLVVGSVFFVASAPVVVPYHAVKGSIAGLRGSYDVFVYPPYEYTVLRDLGDF